MPPTNKKRKKNKSKTKAQRKEISKPVVLKSPPNYENFLQCQAFQSASRIVTQYQQDLAYLHNGKIPKDASLGIDFSILNDLFNHKKNDYSSDSSSSSSSSSSSNSHRHPTTVSSKPNENKNDATSKINETKFNATITKYLKGTNEDPNFDRFVWINGAVSLTIPKEFLTDKGSPYIGWAFCQNGGGTQAGTGFKRRYYYCLGVFKCPDCDFVARPWLPSMKKKKKFTPPPDMAYNCPRHDLKLIHVSCECQMTQVFPTTTKKVIVNHSGDHNHLRPPVNKPAPGALQELEKVVNINPDLGAAKMKIPAGSRKAIIDLDDSFANTDRAGYYKRKIQNKNKKPVGIRGSIGAFLEFYQDLPEDFIVHMELLSADANIITMQCEKCNLKQAVVSSLTLLRELSSIRNNQKVQLISTSPLPMTNI